ncbi:MAG: hypothetical protein V1827_00620 [Candidatus Micrarchaeota archaeon]
MGFWDSILGSDRSDAAPEMGKPAHNPFNVGVKFAPLRLSAKAKSSVDLVVKVTNASSFPQLVSVDALLPRDALIGFDPACINKAAEKRVGELKAGSSIDVPITIWSSHQTQEGNYPITVTVYSHYIGYEKVLSYVKKSTSLRAV